MIVPTLSTVDGSNLNRAFTNVNANFWCSVGLRSCAKYIMQMVAEPMVMHSAQLLGRLLHTNLHKNGRGCKTLKGNQIIALTQKKDKRIFRSGESHPNDAKSAPLGWGTTG